MLESIDKDLWCVDGDVLMSRAVHFPARMTVMRLADGGLLLHSPLPISDALAAELEAQGPIRHLVAPNAYHHLYVGPAQERWPEARTWVAPGLPEKRPDLRYDGVLGDEAPPEWRGQIDQVLIAGVPKMGELAFVHRPSRTLVVTDLIFNVHRGTKTWLTPWVLRLFGAWKRTTQSRFWRWLTKDRAAAGASVERLLALDFDRIVVAHGDPIDSGGKAAAEKALAWMRAGAA